MLKLFTYFDLTDVNHCITFNVLASRYFTVAQFGESDIKIII